MSERLVDDCLALDLAWLMRLGPVRTGQRGSGKVQWSIGGTTTGEIRFRLDLRKTGTASLILKFNACGKDGIRQPVTQIFCLEALPQNFGGLRWWLHCPATGKRVRTLHLAPGRNLFASREALGLAYRVERLDHFDRAFEKVFRAQRRLGQPHGLGHGLERPKGMWRRTFNRHVAALERHDLACGKQIAALIPKSLTGAPFLWEI